MRKGVRSENGNSERIVGNIIVKIWFVIFISILVLPFIICDLYFGLYNKYENCSTIEPPHLITLRMFLVVDAVMSFFMYIYILIYLFTGNIYNDDGTIQQDLAIHIIDSLGRLGNAYQLFQVIWLAGGSAVFFGYIDMIYECKKIFTIYMTALLSIKMALTFYGFLKRIIIKCNEMT